MAYTLPLYNVVQIGPFILSIWFFIQVLLYLTLIIILSRGDQNKNDLMIGFIVIIIALPILTNCVGTRYFSWSASIFYIIILFRKKINLVVPLLILEIVIDVLYDLANIATDPSLIIVILFLLVYTQTGFLIYKLLKLKNNVTKK
jgi:hypothetical protein